MREAYDHNKIEGKWQKKWEKAKIYQTLDKSKSSKYYCLIEFPYPSGDGLHTGHVRSYTAMDVIARKRRAEGKNVLYPIGWDAFGLPTENFAIKTKIPPKKVTKDNTDNFRRQLKALGLSFDWSREINTTDPKYYKWTQWIFLEMFKKGLAYKKKMSVNWCPKDKCVLANEEVIDGKCERCGTETEKRLKEQWMLAITKYADRLYEDLDTVDYVEKIKIQQRNWIGRSEGALINFKLNVKGQTDGKHKVEVFTTRPDTLFGATFLAISPELANRWIDMGWNPDKKIKDYIDSELKERNKDKYKEAKDKTGIDSLIEAINPANNEKIPVWIVNYVLGDVGTGAIMAVPAHDDRDYEFAKKFNLPIKEVVLPVRIDKRNPPINGKKIVERRNVQAIVFNPKDNTYLTLWSEKYKWTTFPMGGVNDGEDIVEAAKREVLEETGYYNLKLKKVLGGQVYAGYFATHKDENRISYTSAVLFELVGDERKPVSAEERAEHEPKWLSKKDTNTTVMVHAEMDVWLDRLEKESNVYIGAGRVVDSGKFSGLGSEEAKKKISEFVGGKWTKNYKLRDWVFSRQRYWGEPIPIINCGKCGFVPVSEKDLPVKLPEVKAYTPTDTGESPLAKVTKWVNVKCPKCKGKAQRETDTMPQWAGSSWYFLRYIDPKNNKALADKQKIKQFMPVDWYNGGMEHTTLHLLYSRFWHKFLFDIGVVNTSEPYAKRTSHGLILAEGGDKMSKSKGNTVSPDSFLKIFGADSLRLYEMFIGPFDQSVVWNEKGIIGPRRFLERVWNMQKKVGKVELNKDIDFSLNKAIKNISSDIETMGFNTGVSSLMILSNEMDKMEVINKSQFELFLRILAPFAPHITEEIWEKLGNKKSIHLEAWPKYDESKIKVSAIKIAVQVNGKLRGDFETSVSASEEEIKKKALNLEKVMPWLKGKNIKKTIYVKGKLVSIVTD